MNILPRILVGWAIGMAIALAVGVGISKITSFTTERDALSFGVLVGVTFSALGIIVAVGVDRK